MPTYLLQMTGDGVPVGVFTPTHDYFDPQYEGLRAQGREVVYSQLPSVPWADFIHRLADTLPSRHMRWDTYQDPSSNLEIVLSHANRDLETVDTLPPE